MVFNLKNTISQIKRFIGKKFSDPSVQQDIHDVPYNIIQMPDDNIGIQVNTQYCNTVPHSHQTCLKVV